MSDELDAAVDEGKGGIYLSVHARPGAKRPALRGMHGGAVKIAVKAAAQEGRANAALERFVADGLGLPAGAVRLVSGKRSRAKRLFIEGDAGSLRARLRAWMAGD